MLDVASAANSGYQRDLDRKEAKKNG
jgi:hypothetical protein